MLTPQQKKIILIIGISSLIILGIVIFFVLSSSAREALFGEAVRGYRAFGSGRACTPDQWKYWVVGAAQQNPSTGRYQSTILSSGSQGWQRESLGRLYGNKALIDFFGFSQTNEAWAVGESVMFKKYQNGGWQGGLPDSRDARVGSFVGNTVYAVWGTSFEYVWLATGHPAGSSAPDGLIRYARGYWTSYPTSGPVYGLWGTSRDDIWAVGEGFILRYAGHSWTKTVDNLAGALFDIWGTSSQNVWAVGESGTILHYDGVRWTPQASTTLNDLRDIWGSSPSNIWVVGNVGTLLRYDGASWTVPNVPRNLLPEGFSLEGVFGSSASDVFVVGENGLLLHFDGHSWELQNAGTTVTLKAGQAVLRRPDTCGAGRTCVRGQCLVSGLG